MRERVAKLIENNINLIAYHLPLDAHEQYGNNAQLALQLGLQTQSTFGDQNLGHLGVNLDPLSQHNFTTANLAARVSKALGKEPLVIDPSPGRSLQNIAWCTGGAQSWFEDAIKAGADAFITGEISEPQAHLARESGVAFLACGHHATERGGARALGEALAQKFEINHLFIDINNPA
jgi:dinuclear metal center YbgI/SA1388 family protein